MKITDFCVIVNKLQIKLKTRMTTIVPGSHRASLAAGHPPIAHRRPGSDRDRIPATITSDSGRDQSICQAAIVPASPLATRPSPTAAHPPTAGAVAFEFRRGRVQNNWFSPKQLVLAAHCAHRASSRARHTPYHRPSAHRRRPPAAWSHPYYRPEGSHRASLAAGHPPTAAHPPTADGGLTVIGFQPRSRRIPAAINPYAKRPSCQPRRWPPAHRPPPPTRPPPARSRSNSGAVASKTIGSHRNNWFSLLTVLTAPPRAPATRPTTGHLPTAGGLRPPGATHTIDQKVNPSGIASGIRPLSRRTRRSRLDVIAPDSGVIADGIWRDHVQSRSRPESGHDLAGIQPRSRPVGTIASSRQRPVRNPARSRPVGATTIVPGSHRASLAAGHPPTAAHCRPGSDRDRIPAAITSDSGRDQSICQAAIVPASPLATRPSPTAAHPPTETIGSRCSLCSLRLLARPPHALPPAICPPLAASGRLEPPIL
ncbi:serine/arginine repetitive matrix protein 1-like [Zingiber officinale]|uniref:serine/arginine repetitive matrix protein 1-like n=1 Tax=Zingiber officinale TaxID=94328 RepID=UPI001C4D63C3|nr:serine/arginine repetitive matrix protein 1-like [Zingiber officinale]